ncbi:hypothetical protein [Kibdelosporangium phytohabitans]|nr:hypothetical protein [Kibdelosporangium phytohabitans]MBE1461564.1 hypothetical protein [Kibdelosporangium phytohabitans]
MVMSGPNYGLVAQTPAGPITEANGSFDANTVKNVNRVASPAPSTTSPDIVDAYTLQLNTNPFPTTLCAGKPNCEGWLQFVFANNGTSGEIYIKYWLRSYGAPCPPGWLARQIDCYKKSGAKPTPNMPLNTGTMSKYRLTGKVSGPEDWIKFEVAGAYEISSPVTRELVIGTNWQRAEFNVFGLADESTANFNDYAEFHTRVEIVYGGQRRPLCKSFAYSNEANNLSFVAPPPPRTGTNPAVVFNQKKLPPNEIPILDPCAAAETIGDTHERTFAGTGYDFQAAGDFVEAQLDNTFEVQTRKMSGAPNWPDTSINRSVATRMGTTRVALCDGANLMVDGRLTSLPSGGSVSLPTGVEIRRAGSQYRITDKAGHSVYIVSNVTHTDLVIGLGIWPAPVRGLLGNPGGDPRLLESSDGKVFEVPMSFSDLYNRFGNSWRVAPADSLLQQCARVADGIPSGLFYAEDLPPSLRVQSENTCRQAGILRPIWLKACTLDVAVLGTRATAVYKDRQPDVVDGNPRRCSPVGCSGGGRGVR